MPNSDKVTVAVPSFNQGKYLNACLESIFIQDVDIEVFVLDGGSTDDSLNVIRSWERHLSGWRSRADDGQSAAINEGISSGTAPFVCWLNSDDLMLPGMLKTLLASHKNNNNAPAAYGKVFNLIQSTQQKRPVWVEPFNVKRLAIRNIVSQPGTLIRRSAWESVGGVDENLHMSMDFDLWWKLYSKFGDFSFVDEFVAVNRDHCETKTNSKRKLHYKESISIVKKYYGKVPIKWWIYQPYSVWYRSLVS